MRKIIRRLSALALAVGLLATAARAETDSPAGEAYAPAVNLSADLTVGYVAAEGAAINPFVCAERDLVSLNHLVFESLVELDENGQPAPLLADSWTVEDKVWTFKLRSGVVFHNGAPLTAADVLLSYQNFLNAGSNNPYFGRLALISGMDIVDDQTLSVTARYAGYITLYAMTFPVVQQSTLGDALARGTGPYWYTQYAAGTGLRLEMNPLWWKKDAQLQSVAALSFADSGDALQALSTRKIDLFCGQSSSASLYRKLADLTSMDYLTNVYEMLVPNLSDSSLMSDVRMRQAVMYAIDRATVVSNAYLGMGIQCEVPVDPNSWLYESQSAIYYYSPERALQLITSCGWKDLTGDGMLNRIDGVQLKDLTLKLVTYNESTSSIRENAANLLAAYLAKVGVKLNVTVVSKERAAQLIKDRDYDLALVGVQLSDVPNIAAILRSGGALNLNRYNNDDMTALLDRIGDAQSAEALRSVYSEIQMAVVERLPIMGLLFRTGSVLSTRSLAGLGGIRAGDTLNGLEFMSR